MTCAGAQSGVDVIILDTMVVIFYDDFLFCFAFA